MSARDEAIADLAWIYLDTLNSGHGIIPRSEQGIRAAERILAAGYRKPRTITTAEELDALPLYSIVTRNGVPYTKTAKGWQLAGIMHVYPAASLLLNGNATVLHVPEPQP